MNNYRMLTQRGSAFHLAFIAFWIVFLVVVVVYELIHEHHYLSGALESVVGVFGLIAQSIALVTNNRRGARQQNIARPER